MSKLTVIGLFFVAVLLSLLNSLLNALVFQYGFNTIVANILSLSNIGLLHAFILRLLLGLSIINIRNMKEDMKNRKLNKNNPPKHFKDHFEEVVFDTYLILVKNCFVAFIIFLISFFL